MIKSDPVIADANQPTFEQISSTITGEGAALWHQLNSHLQRDCKAAPKIAFSRCAGKPGWNVKYHKSGKSLCTLYPEPNGFMALVVIPLSLVPEVMARETEFTSYTIDLVAGGKPYNGTLWLMMQAANEAVLTDVIKLLEMKQSC